MPTGSFFTDRARQRAKETVQTLESKSSIEVVIVVEHGSARYRSASYLFGFGSALVALIALLFLPVDFALVHFPVDTAVAFLLGSAICARSTTLLRWLSSTREQHEAVARAAKATFYDRGLSKTRRRTGLLVYLSLLERRACLVPDLAVDPEVVGEPWRALEVELQRAVAALDVDGCFAALTRCAGAFAEALPRRDDDVNEIADEMVAT